eukprot:3350443-Pyramimonas_sp.AAC.1
MARGKPFPAGEERGWKRKCLKSLPRGLVAFKMSAVLQECLDCVRLHGPHISDVRTALVFHRFGA